ncbi:hypothetical protein ElyMa_003920500 [Elysia marginata]|uniref:Uncharacterized protein n=1 Tax=Elysia marginata TaxID=1093978 RepID=A0AAV4FQJ4_9GAST|nr:hypothetical protein ElyMa_003920500 [Elysia marginata]
MLTARVSWRVIQATKENCALRSAAAAFTVRDARRHAVNTVQDRATLVIISMVLVTTDVSQGFREHYAYRNATSDTLEKDVEATAVNTALERKTPAIMSVGHVTWIVIQATSLHNAHRKTGETPISLTILQARWRLFGHILRQAINTPPNVAMTNYFMTEGSKQRSRPKTSIVTTLRRDLKSHNNDHWPTRLHSITDLDHLRDKAHNRSDWKHLTTAIYRSAQADMSVDVAVDGH